MGEKMLTAQQIENQLPYFSGTETWHRWSPLFPKVTLTEGTKWLADNAGAYWLMDAIASYQKDCEKDEMLCDMQFWTLRVNEDKTATLICERDTDDVAFKQEIEYTDFPLKEIKLYCASGGPQNTMVILLPGEY